MNNECTIIINSCDTYSDLWEPFFKLFKIYWSDCPYKIILNTESEKYSYPGLEIETLSLYEKNQKVSWGKRMIDHLKSVDSEYTLLLLDDFFIRSKVNQDKIEQCLKWMKTNPNIAVFSFEKVLDKDNEKSDIYYEFERRPQKSEYRFNLQAGIWRTKDLIEYIKPHETPWEWEVFGNFRSFDINKEFYTIDSDIKEKIIDYGFIHGGVWGVFRGKWILEDVKPLFLKHDIHIDYKKRGFYTEPRKVKRSFHRKIMRIPFHLKKHLHYKWRRYLSLGLFWRRYLK